ncbi:hypothetical protein CMQ_2274 [Grosmannia clavigera kw1407]|uniref:Uncharacterized protein n=1 Tax=Grosmannia clavigera (strain kw1407 / UAMH 11150) TaxID=655863 RepID=F0XJD2_GROCL|nr:uncharacterized protein CMQ_2274 [Grosmannia clavigera kw1407]EFX02225.1 hypothetical protein CMQ_2274 [Grosmannia clavigera kw1407]
MSDALKQKRRASRLVAAFGASLNGLGVGRSQSPDLVNATNSLLYTFILWPVGNPLYVAGLCDNNGSSITRSAAMTAPATPTARYPLARRLPPPTALSSTGPARAKFFRGFSVYLFERISAGLVERYIGNLFDYYATLQVVRKRRLNEIEEQIFHVRGAAADKDRHIDL